MADMDRLIAEAGLRDIRIIMDMVINHTSDEHEWFQKSRNRQSPYRDYYVWRPGKPGKLPNNWTSFFGEKCWEYDIGSGEYYLHLFAKKQPDLNWRNPKVLQEIEGVLKFWLDKGIAGFRCDVVNVLFKESLRDGKRKLVLTGSEHYLSREGTHEILRRLRKDVLDRYDCFTVGETVFVTPQTGRDLCDADRRELDMIFSFEHMETDQWRVKWFKRRFHAGRFGQVIAKWQRELDWNANYLENHDQPRSVSRFGDDNNFWMESAKMLCVLLMTLRGTPFVYQGQEIGMTNFDFAGMGDIRDVESVSIHRLLQRMGVPAWLRWRMIRATSRDNARTPMQWSEAPQAGFTTGTPWLGMNGNCKHVNMAGQQRDPGSIRSFYKTMIALRAGSDVLKSGTFELLEAGNRLFAFRRAYEGVSLTVLLSFSRKEWKVPYQGNVVLSSYGRPVFDGNLKPYEAVILNRNIETR
jgi:oligo-1,6-glucosidase